MYERPFYLYFICLMDIGRAYIKYVQSLRSGILITNVYTVVSRASTHYRVSAHVPNFKGSLLQLPYKHMEFISRVSAHVGQNHELCLSAHGRLPGTLRYVYIVVVVIWYDLLYSQKIGAWGIKSGGQPLQPPN